MDLLRRSIVGSSDEPMGPVEMYIWCMNSGSLYLRCKSLYCIVRSLYYELISLSPHSCVPSSHDFLPTIPNFHPFIQSSSFNTHLQFSPFQINTSILLYSRQLFKYAHPV